MEQINFNDYFYYDETSPSCLRWKVERRGGKNKSMLLVKAGDAVDTLNTAGYYIGTLMRKIFRVHRVIWQMFNGDIPEGFVIDHIDQNKSNNKLSNLRMTTIKGNSHNCKMQSNNKSGFTGVYKGSMSGRLYWKAGWQDGKLWKHKSFSISKYTDEGAYNLACDYRIKMLKELNLKDGLYTDMHGL